MGCVLADAASPKGGVGINLIGEPVHCGFSNQSKLTLL